MTISLISTALTNTVTLGNGTYGTDLTITSTGSVENPVNDGVDAPASVANASITNQGTVSGGVAGVEVFAAASVTNSGAIIGSYVGVGLVADGTVTNSGTISGDTGIYLFAGGTVTNSGSISSANDGIYLLSGGTITNSGAITGGSYALDNVFGALTLNVEAGGVFTGEVDDNAGTGLLAFAGTTAGSLDLGTSFSGFSSIAFGPAAWSLTGDIADLSSTVAISGLTSADHVSFSGFTLGDSLILDGFAATSDTFVTGTGLVLSNGTSSETIGLDALPSGDRFAYTSSGGNTTIMAAGLVSIISTALTNTVTLGNGTYTPGITITRTGSVETTAKYGIDAPANVANASITNQGTVSGGVDGVFASTAAAVTNSGTISGSNVGVGLFAGGTVTNSGTISGGTYALASFFGALTVEVEAGGVFNGKVADNAGTGLLAFAGTTAGSLNLGTSFTGFSSIAFGPAAWSLTGDIADLSSTVAISGLTSADHVSFSGFTTLGDSLILEGFAATSETFVTGTGLVLSNGTSAETIGLSALPSEGHFVVTSSAAGTTITVAPPISIISTALTNSVTLGNGTYAPGITVTSTGSVKTTAHYGIDAPASLANASITNQGTISGAGAGIELKAGSTVTNSGIITGGEGIVLQASGTVINTGTISGFTGVSASAAISLTNNGAISGSFYDGVYLASGGTVTNSGAISGAAYALYNKAGALTLNVDAGAIFNGKVDDNTGTGLLALAGTTAGSLNLGTSFTGFSSIAFGPAAWTLAGDIAELANAETISGFATAGDEIILTGFQAASESISGTNLILTSGAMYETLALTSALPAGDHFAFTSSAAGTTIAVSGLVSIISTALTSPVTLGNGTYAAGITITSTGSVKTSAASVINDPRSVTNASITNQGTVSGGAVGVRALAAISVTNSGAISGTDEGVVLLAGGAVTNSGIISGSYNKGIYLLAGGAVINSGTISSADEGIELGAGGTVTNSGAISGGTYALYNATGALTLYVDAGAVFNGAVDDNAGTGLLILAGTTAGSLNLGTSFSGFSSLAFGSAAWSLTGDIADLGSTIAISGLASADHVSFSGFTLGDNLILEGFAATSDTFAAGTGLVLSSGTTSETIGLDALPSGDHFALTSSGGNTTIAVKAPISIISTGLTNTVTLGNGTYTPGITVTSTGSVKTTVDNGSFGIYDPASVANASITNQGTVSSLADGVIAEAAASVINGGAISGGNVDFPDSAGVDLVAGGTVTNSGAISGSYMGVVLIAGGTVINSGGISGIGEGGDSTRSDGIYLKADGAVTNSGAISGYFGVHAKGGTASVANTSSGTITSRQYGIELETSGTVTNNGAIDASFVGVVLFAGGTVTNSGTINNAEVGIALESGGTVTNSGTVSGSVMAVNDTSGTLILDVEAGAVFQGTVNDTPGTGTLNLAGTTAGSLDMNGTFEGFSQINFDQAKWTLAGDLNDLLSAETITGFTFGDAIDLTGFAATTETFISGTGLVLSNGLSTETLRLSGNFTGEQFFISTLGGTTSIALGIAAGATIPAGSTAALPGGSIASTTLAGGTLDVSGASTLGRLDVSGTGASLSLSSGASLTLNAPLTIANGASLEITGGALVVDGISLTGALTVSNGHLIDNGQVVNNGAFFIDPSTMTVDGSLTGTGAITIGAGSELDVTGDIGPGQTIVFDGTDAVLGITDTASIAGTLSYLTGGTIDITDLPLASLSGYSFDAATDILDITITGGANPLEITFSGNLPGPLATAADGQSGTDFMVLCYRRGTRILTPTGAAAIETLDIGDEVVTRFGGVQKIKWLGRQSYAPHFLANNREKWPVHITPGALDGTLPLRDLYISPGHSMLIGETLILAKNLVNGITIRQAQPGSQLDYINIELETHDCICAEGSWAETYADAPGMRAQFHNAASFHALYPDHQETAELCLCAPRPQAGPDLEAALLPIASLAARHTTPGPLEGYIDLCTPSRISGWARDPHHPQLPVPLSFWLNETKIGTALACDPRGDLAQLGLGNAAFAVIFTPALTQAELAGLTIRHATTGAKLPNLRKRAA